LREKAVGQRGVAVGHREFIEEVKVHFGIKAIGKDTGARWNPAHFTGYLANDDFGTEKGCLS